MYFDVDIGGQAAGRIIFGLYGHVAPKTTNNFATLCEGYKDAKSGKLLTYEGSVFHKVIPHVMAQGGDITYGSGLGDNLSIYGDRFDDENYIMKHSKPYLLSMTKEGPAAE